MLDWFPKVTKISNGREKGPLTLSWKQRKTFVPNNKIFGQTWETFDLLTEVFNFEEKVLNYFYSLFVLISDIGIKLTQVSNGERKSSDFPLAISSREFSNFCGIKYSFLMGRIMHCNKSEKKIYFDQFCCSLFNLCSLHHSRLSSLLFSLYDACQRKYLTEDQLSLLIEDVADTVESKNLLAKRGTKFLVFNHYENIDILTFPGFLSFIEKYIEIVNPILDIHRCLTNKVMSLDWWTSVGQTQRHLVVQNLGALMRKKIEETGIRPSTASNNIKNIVSVGRISSTWVSRRQRRNFSQLLSRLELSRIEMCRAKEGEQKYWQDSFLEYKNSKNIRSKNENKKQRKIILQRIRETAGYRVKLMKMFRSHLYKTRREKLATYRCETNRIDSFSYKMVQFDTPWLFDMLVVKSLEAWFLEHEKLSLTLQESECYKRETKTRSNVVKKNVENQLKIFVGRKTSSTPFVFVRNPVEEKFYRLVNQYVSFRSEYVPMVGKHQIYFEAERHFTQTDLLFLESGV